MVMTFIKKSLAMLFILLVLLMSDYILIYGMNTRMQEALLNSVDGAIIVNMDNMALAYAEMDTYYALAEETFYAILQAELELDEDLKNDTFFKHGVVVEGLYIGWHDQYPIVRAQISTTVDTMILRRFLPALNEIVIDNYDHLYWQWS